MVISHDCGATGKLGNHQSQRGHPLGAINVWTALCPDQSISCWHTVHRNSGVLTKRADTDIKTMEHSQLAVPFLSNPQLYFRKSSVTDASRYLFN